MIVRPLTRDFDWDRYVDLTIRAFQRMTQSIKFCPRPVVVAPYTLCLGGGTEISLHGARRQAHAELYMGLVETGVGLIPGGGGTKEFALKATDEAIRAFGDASRVAISTEIVAHVQASFDTEENIISQINNNAITTTAQIDTAFAG